MSDAAAHRRKVSREGVVLLKSFEGFRARAERDGEGWVIGYGHRKSAREGLTVGEADAELLLQYDLMPIVGALNAAPLDLNPHQFDALASFAFSVGVERFLASDVHARLAEGRPDAAADALLAWSETPAPVSGLRRRAAERALFLADPSRPVALADLLSAPLPANTEPVSPPDVRAAAVAALLGETSTPEPAQDVVGEAQDEPLPTVVVPAFETPPEPAPEPTTPAGTEPVPGPVAPSPSLSEVPLEAAPSTPRRPMPVSSRALPYGAAVVGPLPGFPLSRPAPPPVRPTFDPAPAPLPAAEPVAAFHPTPAPPPAAVEPVPFSAAPVWPSPMAPEPLVLTPAPEADPAEPRSTWDEAERSGAAPTQEPLFTEAPSSVSILRHEVEPDPPRRFDWSETGMYVIMGGLGLVSCAVSAAAFRVAAEDPSPMGETTAVAWTLAVIGAVCVGAASWHLYVRTMRRKT